MAVITLLYRMILPLSSKWYTAKWHYMAWLVIAAGWLFPFRPQINLSFLPVQMPEMPVMPVQSMISVIPSGSDTEAMGNNPASTISLWLVLMVIWGFGVISIVIYHGLRHGRFMRIVSRWSEPVTDLKKLEMLNNVASELGIKIPVGLRMCQGITSPMLIGFFRPVILLPDISIAEDELPLILEHELIHLKRHDLWYKALILAATTLHWFNPVVYLMAKGAALQCEISCDALVLAEADFEQRRQYGETILGIVRNGAKLRTALSTNFYEGKRGMKNRIFSIMDTKKKKAGAVVLCMAVAGIIMTGAAFAAASDQEPANASERDVSFSDKEIAEQEQERREEIAEQYAVYTKYGLTYNKEKDRFFYNGQLVRFFADKLDDDGFYTSFSYTDGDIDLRGVRSATYELMGIEPVSQEEYDQRTAKIKASSKSSSAIQENTDEGFTNISQDAIETGDPDRNTSAVTDTTQENVDGTIITGDDGAAASETGDPNYGGHSLSAYTQYGVSYNKKEDVWMYQEKPIHFLFDKETITFIDNSSFALESGWLLKVIRSTDGNIEGLTEMTQAEVDAVFN